MDTAAINLIITTNRTDFCKAKPKLACIFVNGVLRSPELIKSSNVPVTKGKINYEIGCRLLAPAAIFNVVHKWQHMREMLF